MSEIESALAMGDFSGEIVQGSVKKFMNETQDGEKIGSSRDLWYIDRKNIRVIPGYNARIQNARLKAHIRAIADSIKLDGFRPSNPLTGHVAREGDELIFYVVGGHCRLEAVDLVEAETGESVGKIPVIATAQGTSMEDLTVDLARSNATTGKELEPYELAMICKRMLRFNWSHETMAQKSGITRAYLDNLLILAGAPSAIREMVIEDQVSASTAIDAIKAHGSEAVSKLQAALDSVKKMGGERITKKHIEPTQNALIKKQVAKAAPRLYASLGEIRKDQGYAGLSADLRAKLDEIFAQIGVQEAAAE
jgi:ParB family chromosome partitioning protein